MTKRWIPIALGVLAVIVVTVMTLLLSGNDGEPQVGGETSTTTAPTTTTGPTTTAIAGDSLQGPVDGPLTLDGEDGLVIEGITVSNPEGNCVEIAHSNDITIRDSQIGPCGGYAVVIDDSTSVHLQGLAISETESGIYAHASESISVVRNVLTDAGRNFVQFDKVTGSGNEISENEGRNQLGDSDLEDMISLYSSSGTDDSPLLVVGNVFANGGPSESGSGIMIGDNGGSDIVVEGNTLTNPGQVGIGVSGGTDSQVIGNEIFSDSHPWSNVGIYVWNQSDDSCGDIEVRDNRVDWSDREGAPHASWDSGDCGEVAGWDENEWNADLG